jgi:hypothetical protein
MSRFSAAATLLAALTVAPFTAVGAQDVQPAKTAGVRDPGDPNAAVPAARYRSAFERYRPNAEAEVGTWRAINDTVGRIGGWRVYGREAIADAEARDAPAASKRNGDAGPAPQPAHDHKHQAR